MPDLNSPIFPKGAAWQVIPSSKLSFDVCVSPAFKGPTRPLILCVPNKKQRAGVRTGRKHGQHSASPRTALWAVSLNPSGELSLSLFAL